MTAKESKVLEFAKRHGYEVDEVSSLVLRLLEANGADAKRLAEIEQCVNKKGEAWGIWCAYTGASIPKTPAYAEQTRLF